MKRFEWIRYLGATPRSKALIALFGYGFLCLWCGVVLGHRLTDAAAQAAIADVVDASHKPCCWEAEKMQAELLAAKLEADVLRRQLLDALAAGGTSHNVLLPPRDAFLPEDLR